MVRIENMTFQLDPNSMFKWEELNETKYLNKVFEELNLLGGDLFSEFEFIIFAHQDGKAIPATLQPKGGNAKRILFFLSNEKGGIPAELADSYFAVFKCYMGGGESPKNMFPFPLGYANGTKFATPQKSSSRPINLFYNGNLNKNRVKLHYVLNKDTKLPFSLYQLVTRFAKNFKLPIQWDFSQNYFQSHLRFTNGFKQGDSNEYSQFLKSSKIALCPKGFFSAETYRHYETMKSGCVIISEKLPDNILYKDSPIIQVDNWAEGLDKANTLLNDPEKLDQLQEEVLDWWETRWCEKAMAQYLMDCLNSLLKN